MLELQLQLRLWTWWLSQTEPIRERLGAIRSEEGEVTATTRVDRAAGRRRHRGGRGDRGEDQRQRQQGPQPLTRHRRWDREVTATVIVVPVVVLSMLFVVQFGLASRPPGPRRATQDGAAAGARADSTPGRSRPRRTVDRRGLRSLLESHTTAAVTDGETVTVSAHGKVIGLIPFLGAVTVHASSTAKVESSTRKADHDTRRPMKGQPRSKRPSLSPRYSSDSS
jgi:hypothetical protein